MENEKILVDKNKLDKLLEIFSDEVECYCDFYEECRKRKDVTHCKNVLLTILTGGEK